MSGNAASEPIDTPDKSEKPVVLNQSKLDEMHKHHRRGDHVKFAPEADCLYKEYLCEESHAMTKKWENSLKATIKAKDEKRLECERKDIDETDDRFKQLKHSDEMKRFMENVHPTDLMQKMGSLLLENGYETSKCVVVPELQCSFHTKCGTMKQELELTMGRDDIDRDKLHAGRPKFNIVESKCKQDEFKKEYQFIKNKERQQTEKTNAKCEEECEMDAQLSKERRILEKKKEAKRIIALEAMQMAEMRRIREKASENQASIFSEGNNINKIKKQHEKELLHVKERFYSNALVDIKNIQVNEDKSIERTVDEFQGKLKFKDQAKVEEKRRIKQLQIKNHLDDLAREKILKQRKENELKRDIENSSQNVEVNFEFDRQKRLEIMKPSKEHRRIINEQMEERKQNDREKHRSNFDSLNEMNIQVDKAFSNYGDELVSQTIRKNRPVYPLPNFTDEYERTSNVNSKKLVYQVDELKAMRPHK